MIVCLCKGVSDRTLEEVIDEGANTLKAVQKKCGAGGDCGSCRFHIAKMIAEQAEDKESVCDLPLQQTG